MANTQTKRVRLSEEQIIAIAKEYLKKDITMQYIAENMKLEVPAVRNAIYGLKKAGVEFPDKPRETSSRYSVIASKLLKK